MTEMPPVADVRWFRPILKLVANNLCKAYRKTLSLTNFAEHFKIQHRKKQYSTFSKLDHNELGVREYQFYKSSILVAEIRKDQKPVLHHLTITILLKINEPFTLPKVGLHTIEMTITRLQSLAQHDRHGLVCHCVAYNSKANFNSLSPYNWTELTVS